jgi:DNA-binding transcriptional regulator YbjK
LFQVLVRDVSVVYFVTVLLTLVFTLVAKIESRIITQFRNQVDSALQAHLQGIVIAKVSIQDQIRKGHSIAYQA